MSTTKFEVRYLDKYARTLDREEIESSSRESALTEASIRLVSKAADDPLIRGFVLVDMMYGGPLKASDGKSSRPFHEPLSKR